MRLSYTSGSGYVLPLTDGAVRAARVNGMSLENEVDIVGIFDSDGGIVVSENIPPREIGIHAVLTGSCEEARKLLYSAFRTHDEGTLFVETQSGSYNIRCRTKRVSAVISESEKTADITLMCPSPYFEAQVSETTILSGNESEWEFDWEFFVGDEFVFEEILPVNSQSVTNNGDVAVGCIFTIHAVNDTAGIIIRNADTQEYMQFAPAQIAAGSTYYIDTRTGHKSCTYRPTEDMELIMDAPSLLTWGSTFLQAAPGVNRFYVTATGGCGGIEVSVVHTDLFSGV